MSSTQRTAIVTGAARGIGAAIALRLAKDGYAVGVVDLHADKCADTVAAISEMGGRAVAVGADISKPDQAAAAVETIAAQLGGVGVLVNNAGITRDNLLFKMSDDDWDSVIEVHLRGSFLMTRAAQRHMVDAGWGRIINISSTSALGARGQVNYSAVKAGLQGFTKALAIELGKFGITANAVAPGFVVTEMTRASAERIGISFDEQVQRALTRIPLGRPGRPEDIANTVSFFASEDAAFVSGQVLYVAGGPRG
ncbi:SDR family oxidoreductase [Nocardia panacis]|uniref:3-oxoacyl-[acyl-carrier-protein] reductase MabA n=1 Tax=Nocardia panacis TaxID=2340916 RepID=A0A3A4K485_9NOCA|nr:3-oxoacyl-ACP reductase FabG [Nocardia panacis]RJO75123.1 SDR family oxidoreductase [Nocardia panacis]